MTGIPHGSLSVGQDQQVGGGVVVLRAVDGAGEVDPAADAERVRLAPVCAGVALADDDEVRIGPRARERGDRVGETLALEGVADEEEDAAFRLDRELLAEPAVLRAGEAGHVDRGRDDFDPVGGNSVHPA